MSATSGFILVLLGFGFLIFVHELGHFLAAKWAGIRADGFAIGMGPCLASYRKGVGFCFGSADAKVVRLHGKRPIEMPDDERERLAIGETEYSLRALPLGGYVRMLGQEDGNPEATSDDARSFAKAAIPKRAVVILAGIAANLVLAIVLFLVAFLAGVRFPAPSIGFVVPGSPAANAAPSDASKPIGLQPGDQVVAVSGEDTKTFLDLKVAAAMAKPETPLAIEVLRGGERLTYTATPAREASSGLLSIGVEPVRSSTLTDVRDSREDVARMLRRVLPDASSLGISAGSRVLAVDGKPVSSYAELDRAARAASGDSVEVEWSVDQLHAKSERQSTRMAMRPEFEVLRGAEGDGIDQGLIGLVPLARVIEFASGSLNTETLKEGDVILRVGAGAGTLEGPRTSQLMAYLRSHPNETLPAVVLRDGKETEVSIHTDREARAGVYLEPAWDIARVAQSVDAVRTGGSGSDARDTPAKALSALPLATVLSLDGEPVKDFRDLRTRLVARAKAAVAGQPLAIRVGMRDPSPEAQPHEAAASLSADDVATLSALSSAFPIPETYFDPQFTVLSANGNPITAVSMGFHQTWVMVKQVFLTIDRVARGSVGADQLQGPVGILHTGTKVADEGFMYIVFFLALISVNLAVVNLLPIPIADGGLFLFLMYEKFAGRAPSIAFQNAAALTGIALVAGLFLFTFYNDIARLLH